MEFLYCENINVPEPIMLIDKHIGVMDGEIGIRGDQFQRELIMLDSMGKSRIQVWINSVGGNVVDAMAIFNAIIKSNTPVDTYNCGIAASAAGLIFQAGRSRIMNDYSLLMIHSPYSPSGEAGNEQMTAFYNSVLSMLSVKCDISEEEVKVMLNTETWLDADDCLQAGFCDLKEDSHHLYINLGELDTTYNKWQAAAPILNAALDTKNKKSMDKVLNSLGLIASANEETVLNAVTELKTALDVAVLNATDVNTQLDALKAEKETLETRIGVLEASENEAKEAALNVEAEQVVNSFATRLGTDEAVVAKWVNLYKANPVDTKALIESIPLNATAPVIAAVVEGGESKAYNMAGEMQKINTESKSK